MNNFRIMAEYISEVNAEISELAVISKHTQLLIQETSFNYYLLCTGSSNQKSILTEGIISFIGEWIDKLVQFISDIIDKIKSAFSKGSYTESRKYEPSKSSSTELEKSVVISLVYYNGTFHDEMKKYLKNLENITSEHIKKAKTDTRKMYEKLNEAFRSDYFDDEDFEDGFVGRYKKLATKNKVSGKIDPKNIKIGIDRTSISDNIIHASGSNKAATTITVTTSTAVNKIVQMQEFLKEGEASHKETIKMYDELRSTLKDLKDSFEDFKHFDGIESSVNYTGNRAKTIDFIKMDFSRYSSEIQDSINMLVGIINHTVAVYNSTMVKIRSDYEKAIISIEKGLGLKRVKA